MVCASSLLIICANAALQFKKPQNANYRGENYLSGIPNPLNDVPTEGDNAFCISETIIGMVDGESSQVGDMEIPAKYISSFVAEEVFLNNKAQHQKTGNDEKADVITKELMESTKAGMIKGVNMYKTKLLAGAKQVFQTLASNIPDWNTIFSQYKADYEALSAQHTAMFSDFKANKAPVNPGNNDGTAVAATDKNVPVGQISEPDAVLEFRRRPIADSLAKLNELMQNHYKLITTTSNDYADQILNFKKKINSGVAVVAARIIQNKADAGAVSKHFNTFKNAIKLGSGSDYIPKEASIQGLQYGRSFVALFKRDTVDTITNPDKSKSLKFAYRMASYSQYKFKDLHRVFPEVSRFKDPELKSFTKFDFDAAEGDILLVADSTLVDNFPYPILEMLLNLGLNKIMANPAWEPEGDKDLISVLNEFVQKLSHKDTIKYLFYKVSENKNFKNAKDYVVKGNGLLDCDIGHFFHAFEGKGSMIWRKMTFSKTCVNGLTRTRYAMLSKNLVVDSDVDELVAAYNPTIISKMFGVATKYIQNVMTNPPAGLTKPATFLSYKKIIGWRDEVLVNKKNKEAPIFTKTEADFEKELTSGDFAPVQGDMSIFVNILIKDLPKDNKLVCTEIADKGAAKLSGMVTTFFQKSTNLSVEDGIEEDMQVGEVDQLREEYLEENNDHRLV